MSKEILPTEVVSQPSTYTVYGVMFQYKENYIGGWHFESWAKPTIEEAEKMIAESKEMGGRKGIHRTNYKIFKIELPK